MICTVSCEDAGGKTGKTGEPHDYVSELKLDMSSETLKQEVTVKLYVDGDTTHFHVPKSVIDTEVLKARYIAINTPESTGKIEEYGKTASNFTREKLSSAVSIILETDGNTWEPDSTGSRYLVWVWYKTSENEDYRNLNLEILQNGLAIASSTANNRYGEICTAALAQAREQKLNIYSGQKDPNFYYGEAQELTLKELRCNIADYSGVKVAFEGVITMGSNNSVYVEEYDAETDMYYGISIYYGYGLSGEGLNVLSIGNRARIVGTVQYYEAGGTYQVSGLSYRAMRPDDPNNIKKISSGNAAAYRETDPATFAYGKVDVDMGDEIVKFDYSALAMSTSVSMSGLQVISAYTTLDEESSSYGALTLFCEADGVPVQVRTVILFDDNGNVIKDEAYIGKNINVKGLVDFYDGTYQIKVFSAKDITIND
ncbi:MAG: thermonuclease family protein [Clostridiales bacterium]|nr:thermonuclease family protein [Clostridiales bacterium]